MKHNFIILGIALLLLSCGNRKGGGFDETYDGGYGVGIDTATINQIDMMEDSVPTTNEEAGPGKTAPKTTSPSKDRYKSTSHDNLRGFDPASEDDMHDNGMMRYMEVNDEEGWD